MSGEYKLPVYLKVEDMRRELDSASDPWSRDRTRQFFRRNGWTVKVGYHVMVSTDAIRKTLPELYERLFSKHARPPK